MGLLTHEERDRLIGLLLALPEMDLPERRALLLMGQPADVREQLEYSPALRPYIMNIVESADPEAQKEPPAAGWPVLTLIGQALFLTGSGWEQSSQLEALLRALEERCRQHGWPVPPRRPVGRLPGMLSAVPGTAAAARPVGSLRAVPALPPHFVPRQGELARVSRILIGRGNRLSRLADYLRNALLRPSREAEDGQRGGQASGWVGLRGMGGTGKSVLAAAVAREPQVRAAFHDGVFWLPVGQVEPQSLTVLQADLAQALGHPRPAFRDAAEGQSFLNAALQEKSVLLVLDDVWEVAAAVAFGTPGPKSRVLLTTRDAAVIAGLGAAELRVGELAEGQAWELLAAWADQNAATLPEAARGVGRECGHLPLALALSGAMARTGVPWDTLLAELRTANLNFLEHPMAGYAHASVVKAIKVSFDALPAEHAARYLELAVFPKDTVVPEDTVLALWRQGSRITEGDARKVLAMLASRSLLLLSGDEGRRSVSMHDLQYDFLYLTAGEPGKLHEKLLQAYAPRCPNGWASGRDDGYFFDHLAYHLRAAGRRDELRALLLDFRWLQAHLDAGDGNALLSDFDHLPADEELRLVQGAIRLSAHVLAQDKKQLSAQLIGRLLPFDTAGIATLLQQASVSPAGPYLYPLTASLEPAGGPLLRTLSGHSSPVNGVAITPDGRHAVSASLDHTLKVWDLSSGQQLRTLGGHSRPVNGVAITPDGRHAVSASADTTLKVWDLSSGQQLRTLSGHGSFVSAVAITPDGRHAVSASLDTTLKVWDLSSGQQLRTLSGHGSFVSAVAITPDGRHAVSASSDHTLKVWDLSSGQVLTTFAGDGGMSACAISPSGDMVVAGDHGGRVHFLRLVGLSSRW